MPGFGGAFAAVSAEADGAVAAVEASAFAEAAPASSVVAVVLCPHATSMTATTNAAPVTR
jgi:hypothetical protein